MNGLTTIILLACMALVAISASAQIAPGQIDLSRATVVAPGKLIGPERQAVRMLVDEVEKRTRIRLPVATAVGSSSAAIIVARNELVIKNYPELMRGIGRQGKLPEGFVILASEMPRSTVLVAGHDGRGVLYGVGRLLRSLRMERDRITAPASLLIASSPKSKLRGHQLGYRPKTNSYDAWTVPIWEQYIRDLIVFGANAVELIPPRSDDDADSPHFPLPPMQMMVEMSRLLDSYGMDVWIWYPAMDPDYSKPETVEAAVREWGEVFRKLPRVDAVFVPGGDPGHTQPKHLMALLAKQTENLHRYHPKAQMWVSPQGFTQAWMNEFIGILWTERPKWLTGVVYGPQVRGTIQQLRKNVPTQYPIRHYPDITHSRQCQFPVPDWDLACALTEGREGINPRPLGEAVICRHHQASTIGSITYSEGCNDDVNKAIWSALEWDPKADVREVLREYSRYFIGPGYEESFADGLLMLEKNWTGPLDRNEGVKETLRHFLALDVLASPQDRANWRFQQSLYRAYFDAYIQYRLVRESNLERQAIEKLRGASEVGVETAIEHAIQILDDTTEEPGPLGWRARVFELAEALFQSIRMQLSVKRYKAIGVERGANLDSIDVPLNDRAWLMRRLAVIGKLPGESERLKQIDEIVNWSDAGPGGVHDGPRDLLRRAQELSGATYEKDPGAMESVRIGFGGTSGRHQWSKFAETLYDTPLRVRYAGLDPKAVYRIRVVYGPDAPQNKIRLVANNGIEVHPQMAKPVPNRPLEFDIPAAATTSGELMLTWSREPGFGGNGRGCQVCEVWIMRKAE